MLLAEGFIGVQSICLGLALLCIAFVLRRGGMRGQRSKDRDLTAEVHNEIRAREQSSSSSLRGMEVRLYEYGRENEGRVETRLAQLDKLIEEADEKIDQLRFQLAQKRSSEASLSMKPGPDIIGGAKITEGQPSTETVDSAQYFDGQQLSSEQRRTINNLRDAGFAITEIARMVKRTEEEVRDALDEDRFGAADAA